MANKSSIELWIIKHPQPKWSFPNGSGNKFTSPTVNLQRSKSCLRHPPVLNHQKVCHDSNSPSYTKAFSFALHPNIQLKYHFDVGEKTGYHQFLCVLKGQTSSRWHEISLFLPSYQYPASSFVSNNQKLYASPSSVDLNGLGGQGLIAGRWPICLVGCICKFTQVRPT